MAVITYPATEKQVAFVRRLVAELYPESAGPEFLAGHEEEGTFDDKKATSLLIDALLLRKKAEGAARVQPGDDEVPEPGYYAVAYQEVLRFYRVAEGKGRWEGRTFLNRFKSDELGRVYRAEQTEVYAAIQADPDAARKTFARETTHCWRCGRRLTDAISRERGIGPECVKFI